MSKDEVRMCSIFNCDRRRGIAVIVKSAEIVARTDRKSVGV